MLEVKLQDLEKMTSFYGTNNFILNARVIIVINFICLNLLLISIHVSRIKELTRYSSVKAFLRALRFSVPAFTLVLTSSEMCVTIQLQMKEFDSNSGEILALLLSILCFIYSFVWIVFIIIQLGIKNAIRKKQYQLIFRIFNRKTFLQRIYFALLFVKKQSLSIFLINFFISPITVLLV